MVTLEDMMANRKKLILLVLDGFGLSPATKGNAIYKAEAPTLSRLIAEYPYTALRAHGAEVGLRWGEMGNSEVGHSNLGAGRVVLQQGTRITHDIKTREFFNNEVLKSAIEAVEQSQATLHCIGIVSPGGVHGDINHLIALVELARRNHTGKIVLHLIADGRDVTPTSFMNFFPRLDAAVHRANAVYGTVMGRYYAMDRDRRWDRTQAAYDAMVAGEGQQAASVKEAIEAAYARNETDEFISPTVLGTVKPEHRISSGDTVVFTNYRSDRARQLSLALNGKDFSGFTRQALSITLVTFSRYGVNLVKNPVAFPEPPLEGTFAEVISQDNLRQLHLAETEKYAHVTYFFNGGREQEFPGEKRVVINSKKVSTYDQTPEMETPEITQTLLEAYTVDGFDVAVTNFANGDMVGHTGNLDQTIKGIEAIDQALSKIIPIVEEREDILVLTADHGNAEQLIHPDTGDIDKEHTANPVPLLLVHPKYRHHPLNGDVKMRFMSTAEVGILADVAPTLLDLLDLEKSKIMTGESLVPVLKRFQ